MDQSNRGMHPAYLVAAIREKYGTCVALAKQLGIDRSAITHVARRPGFSIPVERLVAAAIGMPLHTIWPDRWSETGLPLPRSQRAQIATPRGVKSSQKRKAA